MHRRTDHWTRLPALLTLLLHLTLVGAGPIVDAGAELEALASAHAGAHVEDGSSADCHGAHVHEFCVVQSLRSMAAPHGGAAIELRADVTTPRAPRPAGAPVRSHRPLPALGPRGPPAGAHIV